MHDWKARSLGAARHVDDYYLRLVGEAEALVALSVLRDVLLRYYLNINDTKTRVMSGVEPLNELWAQRLRHQASKLNSITASDEIVLFLTEALTLSRDSRSDSPVKIALRAMDDIRAYDKDGLWVTLEPYFQRILHHHPHWPCRNLRAKSVDLKSGQFQCTTDRSA